MEFNKLVPELSVSDFEKSLKFYKKLGFKVEYSRENFAFLSFQGSQLMIESNGSWKTGEPPFGRGINFQIEVKDIKPLLEALQGYELFRQMDIPTPRTSFVDLWVNDTHLGLYTMVEAIDKTLIDNNFADNTGNLYKPEMPQRRRLLQENLIFPTILMVQDDISKV